MAAAEAATFEEDTKSQWSDLNWGQEGASKDTKPDVIFYVGKFQPLHNAHLQLIQKMIEKGDSYGVPVIICTSLKTNTAYHPLQPDDKLQVIVQTLEDSKNNLQHRKIVPCITEKLPMPLDSKSVYVYRHRNPFNIISQLREGGFKKGVLMAGHDRRDDYEQFTDKDPFNIKLVTYDRAAFQNISATRVRLCALCSYCEEETLKKRYLDEFESYMSNIYREGLIDKIIIGMVSSLDYSKTYKDNSYTFYIFLQEIFNKFGPEDLAAIALALTTIEFHPEFEHYKQYITRAKNLANNQTFLELQQSIPTQYDLDEEDEVLDEEDEEGAAADEGGPKKKPKKNTVINAARERAINAAIKKIEISTHEQSNKKVKSRPGGKKKSKVKHRKTKKRYRRRTRKTKKRHHRRTCKTKKYS